MAVQVALAGPYDPPVVETPPSPRPPAAAPVNNPPVARARWTPATGQAPSFVQFDARDSRDADPGDALSYAWDLDGDGQFDDATGETANYTYRRPMRVNAGLRVTDRAGAESVLRMEVAAVPSGTIAGTLSRRCRWRAQYFRGEVPAGRPALARCEAAIRHDWDFGRPIKRVGPEGFAARWKGAYRFPGGPIRFEASADDGLRVWLDGRLVFDRWRQGAYGRYAWVQTVRQGVHDVRVEYAERQGTASVAVQWAPTALAPFAPRKVK